MAASQCAKAWARSGSLQLIGWEGVEAPLSGGGEAVMDNQFYKSARRGPVATPAIRRSSPEEFFPYRCLT
jgi:hypothetical protein